MRFSAAIKSIEPVIVKMRMRMFCVNVSMDVASPGDLQAYRIFAGMLRLNYGLSSFIKSIGVEKPARNKDGVEVLAATPCPGERFAG
jgi:hypothetical protein